MRQHQGSLTLSALVMISIAIIMGTQAVRAVVALKQQNRIVQASNWVKTSLSGLTLAHMSQCQTGLLDVTELVDLGFLRLPPEWLQNPIIQLNREHRRLIATIEVMVTSPSDRARLARQTVSGAQIMVTGSGVRWVKQMNGRDHMAVRVNRDVEMFGASPGCP